MIGRRGFIRNGLALLATAALPTPTLDRILSTASPEVSDQLLAIVFKHYKKVIIDQIFGESPLIKHLQGAHA